ncbi:sensor histidine kinase [Geobacter pickeringii]|uniref:sensor histidine kinase n=1 Tax=Geobacter pickeringii TaxID=345632 RepID=UPI00068CCAC2|nr:sensor histidine kinase [Geobacter pickeringii]
MLLSLPAVIFIVYSGYEERTDALNAGVSETKMLVHSILTEQYSLTGDAEQLGTVLSILPIVKERKVGEVNAVLANILQMKGEFANILIADRHGTVWASALPSLGRVSIADTVAFQNVVRTRRFSSGEYTVEKISGKPTIGFGYPVLNSRGEIDGVLAITVNFEYLNGLLTEEGLPKGALFTLADRNGIVVYRNWGRKEKIGKPLCPKVFRRMAAGPDRVSFLDFGRSEERKISSYGRIGLKKEKVPYLYVLAGLPLKDTLARAQRAQLLQVAILSPFLLVAVVLASLLGKFFFVNQINKLREASERLASGDLGVRVSPLLAGGEMAELGRSFDEMAQQLACRENELNALNESLTLRVEAETERRLHQERLLARHARLAAMGEMIGAIAHQWRQPLATLGAAIQSLRMAWERGSLDAAFLESAEADAQKQLYYMSETIEDFCNFFRPEKVAEQFEVREKIAEVVLLVDAQFANAGVHLEVVDAADGEGLFIHGYQNEFKQSVLNLVSNAFDAVVARNGAAPRPTGLPGLVVVTLRRTEDRVLIEVRDNGCGIPPEFVDKVYEPYFTSKPEGKGTGIGLYMSKLIVEESMGGRISFVSSAEGTVFRIELAASAAGEVGNG